MSLPLTRRQKEILEYIEIYYQLNRLAPSLLEIKQHFKLKAVSTVHEHLEKLKQKGYIHKQMNQARGIQTVDLESNNARVVQLPILGLIGAATGWQKTPTASAFAEIPAEWVPEAESCFAITVSGDGWVTTGFCAGDVLVFRRQPFANPLQLVLVRLVDRVGLYRYELRQGKAQLWNLGDDRLVAGVESPRVEAVLVGSYRLFR